MLACITRTKNRLRSWLDQRINPLTLCAKDKNLQSQFNQQRREKIHRRLIVATAFAYAYLIVITLTNIGKWDEQAIILMNVISICALCTFLIVAGKFKLAILDGGVFACVILRTLCTFYLLQQIAEDKPGYSKIDVKQLHESLIHGFFPALFCISLNWVVDLFVSAPMFIICHAMITKQAFHSQDGNLACYVEPDVLVNQYTGEWFMFTCVVFCSQYSSQYYELHIFLQTEQSKKQQKCLQNVFDS